MVVETAEQRSERLGRGSKPVKPKPKEIVLRAESIPGIGKDRGTFFPTPGGPGVPRGTGSGIEPGTISEVAPADEQLVKITAQEARGFGLITQEQLQDFTRPEKIIAITETGKRLERFSNQRITAKDRIVRLEIPGQKPSIAPTGSFLTLPGGPREVSFKVPAAALQTRVPGEEVKLAFPGTKRKPQRVSRAEFQRSAAKGEFIRTSPFVTGEMPAQGTEKFGGRVEQENGVFKVVPITATERRVAGVKEEAAQAVEKSQFAKFSRKFREDFISMTPRGEATKAEQILPSFIQPFGLQQVSLEVGAGFIGGALAVPAAAEIAVRDPASLPTLFIEGLKALPTRAIREPAVVTGEFLFDVVATKGVTRAFGRVRPRARAGPGFETREAQITFRGPRKQVDIDLIKIGKAARRATVAEGTPGEIKIRVEIERVALREQKIVARTKALQDKARLSDIRRAAGRDDIRIYFYRCTNKECKQIFKETWV